MIIVDYGFLGIFSMCFFGIILLTMMFIINFMGQNITTHSLSLLFGIKYLGLICLIHLKRERVVGMK